MKKFKYHSKTSEISNTIYQTFPDQWRVPLRFLGIVEASVVVFSNLLTFLQMEQQYLDSLGITA